MKLWRKTVWSRRNSKCKSLETERSWYIWETVRGQCGWSGAVDRQGEGKGTGRADHMGIDAVAESLQSRSGPTVLVRRLACSVLAMGSPLEGCNQGSVMCWCLHKKSHSGHYVEHSLYVEHCVSLYEGVRKIKVSLSSLDRKGMSFQNLGSS